MCDSQLKLYSTTDIVVVVLKTIDCVVNVLAAQSKATEKQSFFFCETGDSSCKNLHY